MRHYFKIIKLNTGFQFVMIPNNNHDQPMGYSQEFDTYISCKKALDEFRCFVTLEMTEENQHVGKYGNNGYEYRIMDNNGNTMFFNKNYGIKIKAENSMKSIIKRIDSPLK